MILGLLAMGVSYSTMNEFSFLPIIHRIHKVFARHLTNMGTVITTYFSNAVSLNPERMIKTIYSKSFKNTRIFSFNKTNKVALNNLLMKKYYDC